MPKYEWQVVKTIFTDPNTRTPLRDICVNGVIWRWNPIFNHYNSIESSAILQVKVEVPNIDYSRSK